MSVEVRCVDDAEVSAWLESMYRGFLDHAPAGIDRVLRPEMDLSRTWAAFDGGSIVGTLRSFPTTVAVPGGSEVWACALTNVTVATTHRRRGLLSDMLTRDLAAATEREEPVGILIASEYPIYGRFGYGPAAEGARYRVETAGLGFRDEATQTVEHVDNAALRRLAPGVYEQFRRTRPGSIQRTDLWWDRTLEQIAVPGADPWRGMQVVARDDTGAVGGYLRYHVDRRWDQMNPRCVVHVDELMAVTDAAYRDLWRFACDVDLAVAVEAAERCVDEPLGWLVDDARAVRQSARYDFLWCRVLDTAAALGSRRYSCEGRVVFDVVDDAGFAAGRYELDGGPDGARCRRAPAASAGLTIPVDVLGALWMGGVSPVTLAAAGRVDVHDGTALDTAQAMFPAAPLPWCSTWF